jgi:acetyl esterase
MTLDPSIQGLLQRLPEFGTYPIWEKNPVEARGDYQRFCQFANPQAVPIGKTENIKLPGPAAEIPLRIYTPVAAGGAALPGLVYFHGGGFVLGDLDCYDGLCRTLANESGCRVISVDYRLAPEYPFPAAVEDSFAALTWIEANALDLGIDANDIAVAGDSAGGNLAAVMCLLAKQRRTASIAFQLLIYPETRIIVPKQGPFGAGYFLDNRAIAWFHDHYVPKDADSADERLSPLAAKDLSGLPPAYIVTAGFDPLREDGIAYAEKLKAAGVSVMHIDYPTMIHGFFSMPGLIPLASEAIAAAAQAVRKALNQ